MATEILKKVTAQMVLEDGLDAKGNMQYVNQTVQYISKSGYDGDKFLAVVQAIVPCLSNEYSTSNVVKTFTLASS